MPGRNTKPQLCCDMPDVGGAESDRELVAEKAL